MKILPSSSPVARWFLPSSQRFGWLLAGAALTAASTASFWLVEKGEAAPAGNSSRYEFRPGACEAGKPVETQCDANGIPGRTGGFCELRHVEGKDEGDERVYRFQVPSTGRKKKDPLTVTLRADSRTGMIRSATVSTVATSSVEVRKDSQRTEVVRPCTDEAIDSASGCSEWVVNPEMESALELGSRTETVAPDDYSTAEVQDFAFERQIQGWMSQAGLSECDFYQNHLAVSGGAGALTEAGVEEFFNSCDQAGTSSDAATNGLGCRANNMVETLGVPIEAHTEALALANKDLNQQLIHELRSGLLKTLIAMRLSSPGAEIPSPQGTRSWTQSPEAASCLPYSNIQLEEEAASAAAAVKELPEGAREATRQAHALKTALDLLEWKQRTCANTWLQVAVGMSDGRRDDRTRLAQVEGENKVFELMSGEQRTEGYEKAKQVLFSSGVGEKFGLDASMFEDRWKCNSSDYRSRLRKLRHAAEKGAAESASFVSGVVSSGSSFSGWLESRKAAQTAQIEKQLGDATAMCAKAGEEIDTGWFSESGLTLWNNRTLVESVVRKRLAQGDDVSLMAAAYCQAKRDFDEQTDKENKAVLGMTAAAILAAPVAGLFELGGLASYGVYGLGTAAGLTSATVSVHNVDRTYEDLLSRQMALSAGFAKNSDVSEAESAFHQAVLFAALDTLGVGVDGVMLSRNLGAAIQASRAKKIDDSLMALAARVERGEMSSAELAEFARKCGSRAKDCTKWVEAEVAIARAEKAKEGTAVARAESSAAGSSAAADAARVDLPPPLDAPVQAQLRVKHKAAYDMIPKEDHDLVDAIAAELYRKYSPADYQKLMKGELVAEAVQRQVRQDLEEIAKGCAMPGK